MTSQKLAEKEIDRAPTGKMFTSTVSEVLWQNPEAKQQPQISPCSLPLDGLQDGKEKEDVSYFEWDDLGKSGNPSQGNQAQSLWTNAPAPFLMSKHSQLLAWVLPGQSFVEAKVCSGVLLLAGAWGNGGLLSSMALVGMECKGAGLRTPSLLPPPLQRLEKLR